MLGLQLNLKTKVDREIFQVVGFQRDPKSGLIRPNLVGETIDIFVLLDYFQLRPESIPGFRPHPHSGIAGHTTFVGGTEYGASTGKKGSIVGGSTDWMQSSTGVRHWGEPNPEIVSRGFEL